MLSLATKSRRGSAESDKGHVTLIHVFASSNEDAEKAAGMLESIIEKGYAKESIRDPGIKMLRDVDSIFSGIHGIRVIKGEYI